MYGKKIKLIKIGCLLSILFILCLCLNKNNIKASENNYVILGGDAIGLKIDTGVYIAGKYQIESSTFKLSPWKNSDIENGDKIVKIDNKLVTNNMDVIEIVKQTSKSSLNLDIKRKNKSIQTKIDVIKTKNGEQTIGLYLKDKLAGIGTMSFYLEDSLIYASLGHGITDETLSYGEVKGALYTSDIEGIKKAIPGTSGEKRASIKSIMLGNIVINNITGVYGKMVKNTSNKKIIEVAKQEEVKKGKAELYTVINNDKIEKFDVEIIGIMLQSNSSTKGLKVKITDKELIDETGGIIQGMSGSPIVQDNKLIGAISHVSIDDPTIGYGMHIGWMYEIAKSLENN